ncbi:hypothetical protein AYO39_01390 [Actinobacteria bacterium SCGC AG-212-D09]|nr:hypothetical protein AYO39_01390 [Actinobacteria bacterium SCGC AG-212-D09]
MGRGGEREDATILLAAVQLRAGNLDVAGSLNADAYSLSRDRHNDDLDVLADGNSFPALSS